MADIYVRSTDGSDADNGSTWALAKATLAGAAAIDAAGDAIYLSQSHAESSAAAQTISLAGTKASPVRVMASNDAAEPPTSTATASVTTTGANAITLAGSAYFYGITFNCGSGAVNAPLTVNNVITTADAIQVYEECTLSVVATGSASYINAGSTAASNNEANRTEWRNTDIKLSSTATSVDIYGSLIWAGGAALSGMANTSRLFRSGTVSRPAYLEALDLDLSNLPASCPLVDATRAGRFHLHACKLPASWTGGLITGTPTAGFRAEMINCDNADTNYRLWVEDYAGSIRDETTLVMTGGATDGTTPISWKMTTTANANEFVAPLVSPEMAVWNEATAASKTVTVEILHDSATNLTDAEAWLEVEYLGTSGFPVGSVASDKRATPLTTAADQTASSVTWTTTGMTTPNKQKLSVTFTPQEKGSFIGRVCLAKASKTIYVDCEMTVS
ncbi:MAG: hypothetical protein NDI84_07990 [Steroidobacteraceae bacterium]|nr:hypothetical protein [Steroidobacteraceae bacterium]